MLILRTASWLISIGPFPKEIRDRYKGTVQELLEELDEIDGTVKEVDTRTVFEKLEAEERAERYTALLLAN